MIAQSNPEISEQTNFRHLVMDIAWFGLAVAATSRFLSVYAIRLGATPADLGWISSLPALILLVSASAAAWWRRRYGNPVKALFLPGLGMRFLFLLPALAPFLPLQWQPLWLILSVSIPALPQGIASVAFTVIMRESVEPSVMTRLLSRRQLALNVAVAIGALAFGVWLETAPFPLNYQTMFMLAFIFALASLWHCMRIRVTEEAQMPVSVPAQALAAVPQKAVSAWRSRGFLQVGFVAGVIHFAFFTLVPVTPLFLVNRLGANEGFMALFGMVELMAGATASMLAPRIAQKIGTRPMIAVAMVGTALAAIIIALAPNLYVTLIAALISGSCWTAAAGVGLFSIFMENTPIEESTSYSTAFNQVIGLAVFAGPMVGSMLANGGVNLTLVLAVGAGLRLIAGPLVDSSLIRRRYHRRTAHAL